MVTTESVTINVPTEMAKYLITMNPEAELTRNALLLYPYILNQTISLVVQLKFLVLENQN